MILLEGTLCMGERAFSCCGKPGGNDVPEYVVVIGGCALGFLSHSGRARLVDTKEEGAYIIIDNVHH